jgi:hypothetical protein
LNSATFSKKLLLIIKLFLSCILVTWHKHAISFICIYF